MKSVRVCSIYDLLRVVALKDIINDIYVFSQSVNILNRAAQLMIHNWVVEKHNAENYKKSLEQKQLGTGNCYGPSKRIREEDF